MASEKVVTAILTWICIEAMLFVIDATFGTAMDAMKADFTSILSKISLSASWVSTITGILDGWSTFFLAFTVVSFACGVWVVRIIIIDSRYNKPGGY